ncbi:MAG: DUF1905 domain-containing protein [Flammeovirgaceae bacterium]|nr:DUF1905 domain-containing protein [Flammeovirgaceae bacterium]
MLKYTTRILKFNKKGEKTGWRYVVITKQQAQKLKPNTKVSFRVKGKLDDYGIEKTAIIPMGDGDFILPINGTLRRALRKKAGDSISINIQFDNRELTPSHDFMQCLEDEPAALSFFKTLTKSHQNYFSKWIESAKTMHTKTKRIVMAVTALALKQGYPEMIRANKK